VGSEKKIQREVKCGGKCTSQGSGGGDDGNAASPGKDRKHEKKARWVPADQRGKNASADVILGREKYLLGSTLTQKKAGHLTRQCIQSKKKGGGGTQKGTAPQECPTRPKNGEQGNALAWGVLGALSRRGGKKLRAGKRETKTLRFVQNPRKRAKKSRLRNSLGKWKLGKCLPPPFGGTSRAT